MRVVYDNEYRFRVLNDLNFRFAVDVEFVVYTLEL